MLLGRPTFRLPLLAYFGLIVDSFFTLGNAARDLADVELITGSVTIVVSPHFEGQLCEYVAVIA
jgi:hypothetical protein